MALIWHGHGGKGKMELTGSQRKGAIKSRHSSSITPGDCSCRCTFAIARNVVIILSPMRTIKFVKSNQHVSDVYGPVRRDEHSSYVYTSSVQCTCCCCIYRTWCICHTCSTCYTCCRSTQHISTCYTRCICSTATVDDSSNCRQYGGTCCMTPHLLMY